MKRVLIVYNPRSSRYAEVKKEVLEPIHGLKGYIIGKYEVKSSNLDANINNLSKLLKDGDLVISAGGDATGVIAANAILKSKKDVTLSVLPFGNFNDLARTLGTKTLEEVLGTGGRNLSSEDRKLGRTALSVSEEDRFGQAPCQKLHPLEIWVDDKFFRYATCYVTIGMTASAVYLYDQPKMRKKLRTNFGRKISSYTELAKWYFKNRHKKQFLPEFTLNGVKQHPKTSDYAAVNGRSMARVMKGGDDFLRPHHFRHETDRLTSFPRLAKLMIKSIFYRIPGTDTTGDILEFTNPSIVELQAEGEHTALKNIKKIEIKKGTKCLEVITN